MHDSEHRRADQRFAEDLAPGLALLRAVHATGQVTRAAEALGIPQPTASRRLAALGAALGTPVVAGHGRGIRLTRAGTMLAEAAGPALSTVESRVRAVREEIEPERGHVVLGFLHLLGRSLVPNLLGDFRASHPHVRFTLVQGSRQDMLDRLLTGGIDLAFVAPVPSGDPALDAITLAIEELFVSLPATHRLCDRKKLRLAELAGEDFVMLEPGYGLRSITDELCRKAGFTPRIAFEGQDSETLRGLVGAGLGVAILPPRNPVPEPGMLEIPLRPKATRAIGLTWPSGAQLTPAVATFRDHVIASAAGHR